MIDCKTECRWVERCDAASAFKYHRESCPVFGEKEKHTQTNADFIRSMGDIELGNFLSGLTCGCMNCPMFFSEETDCNTHCNSSWQNWLKLECEP